MCMFSLCVETKNPGDASGIITSSLTSIISHTCTYRGICAHVCQKHMTTAESQSSEKGRAEPCTQLGESVCFLSSSFLGTLQFEQCSVG